jgi:hypothetical protein
LSQAFYTWDEWRALGRDQDSQFSDPLFENIAQRDFRLKPGSPAEKLGFKPWDLTLAGVRKDDATWRELAAKGHVYPNWESDAKPWPAPVYQVDQSFERASLGTLGIRNAKYSKENRGESIGVTSEAGSPIGGASKRSLKIQDAPDLQNTFDPVLDIYPHWNDSGTFYVCFDIMAEADAAWFFEMRNKADAFAAGPYLRWQNGTLVANNTDSQKLAELKSGEWLRIEIIATTGASQYDVTITRADGSKNEFKAIPCKPNWDSAHYLLFSGLGNTKTAFFIDNLKLQRRGD